MEVPKRWFAANSPFFQASLTSDELDGLVYLKNQIQPLLDKMEEGETLDDTAQLKLLSLDEEFTRWEAGVLDRQNRSTRK